MRFQYGDIVRITSGLSHPTGRVFPRDRNGKVMIINESEFPVRVRFDGVDYENAYNGTSPFKEHELKLVRRET